MELITHLQDVISREGISDYALELFKTVVWDYYQQFGRTFAWRQTTDPYHILISEVMLQQTQTQRVIEKYEGWVNTLPNIQSLASAPLREVLFLWQGLGYNRRALYLHTTAKRVVSDYHSQIPADPYILRSFPGIGPHTAASICAFAFNMRTIFIETNIRTVFLHIFFQGRVDVTDAEILPLIEQTVDCVNPREWYYALMDLGVFLKKEFSNPNKRSKHYAIQSRFQGSNRQLRGAILRVMLEKKEISVEVLTMLLKEPSERIEQSVGQLVADGLIKRRGQSVFIE